MWINSHASDNAVRQSFLGGVCAKGKVQGDTFRGSKISYYYQPEYLLVRARAF
jgi:hypothetical protein